MKKIYYFCCLLFFALCSLDAVVGGVAFSESPKESENKKYIHIEKDGKHFWGIFDVSPVESIKIEEWPSGKQFSIKFNEKVDLKGNLKKVIEYLSSKIEKLLGQDNVDKNKIRNVFYNARKHFKINLGKHDETGDIKHFVSDSNLENFILKKNYGDDFEYDEDTETLDNIRIGGVGLFYIPKGKDGFEVYGFVSGPAVNLVKVGIRKKAKSHDGAYEYTTSENIEIGYHLIGFGNLKQILKFKKWSLNFIDDHYFIINDLGEYDNKEYNHKIAIEDIKEKTAQDVRNFIKGYFPEFRSPMNPVEPDNVVLIKIEGEQTFRDWAMMWLKEHPKTFRLIKFFGMTAVVTGLYLAYKKFTSGS